jgi:acetyltransferase
MSAALSNDHTLVDIGDLKVTIRPITPDDRDIEAAFVKALSMQTKYERFFEGIRELSPSMLNVLCNVDYVHTMAYVATIKVAGVEKEIGVCRYAADGAPDECELAITVADDYPYQDVAGALLKALMLHAKANNVKRFMSIELSSNARMHTLAKNFKMSVKSHPEDGTLVIYTLDIV